MKDGENQDRCADKYFISSFRSCTWPDSKSFKALIALSPSIFIWKAWEKVAGLDERRARGGWVGIFMRVVFGCKDRSL